MIKKLGFLLPVVLGLMVFACEDALAPTVTEVTVSPLKASVDKDRTEQFFATVTGTNNPAQTVKWTVTGKKAPGTNIDDDGLLTVAEDETAATLTVRATSTVDMTKSGKAQVTVNGNSSSNVLTGTVRIDGEANVGKPLTANTAGLGGTGTLTYQWKRADTAEAVTFSDIPGETSATYTLAEADLGKFIKVTVTRSGSTGEKTSDAVGPVAAEGAPPPLATVTNVTIDPASASVAKGGTKQFSAEVHGTNNPARTVTWAIAETGKNAGTAISASGLLTIAADEALTTLTVEASSTADNTKSGRATVTVTEAAPTVTSVTVSPSNPSVAKGGTQAFTATVNGTNEPAQTVTWAIVEAGKNAGTTINSTSGLLTVAADEALATLTVRATSTEDTSKFDTTTVTVTGGSTSPTTPTVTSVTVSPANPSVLKGGTQQFTATVNGTNSPAQTVTWAIVETGKNAGTAINASGLLTIAAGETLTTLTIRATSTADTGKSGTTTVTFPPLTGTVSISGTGTTQAGQQLTANTGSLNGSGTIGYQWARADTASGSFSSISGATSATYTLTEADLGKYIRLTVTRTGNSDSVNSNALGPVHEQGVADSTSSLSITAGAAATNQTEGSRTGITKVDMSIVNNNWAVATYSLAQYEDREITVVLTVDVKREGAAGNLMWQINNSAYSTVASQNAAAGTWYTMSGTWKGTPASNTVLYLNNDKTAGTTFYYIDNFTVTIIDPNAGGGGGSFEGETWTNSDLGASTFQKTGKNGAYDAEMWNRDKQGTASMTFGTGGAFKCEWDGIYNVLFRTGRKYTGSNRKVHSDIGVFSIEYDGTINLPGASGKRNAYISVYGWLTGGTPDALIEYYIVDYYGEHNPKNSTGAVLKGTVTIPDEGTYELYEVPNNGPTIEGDKAFKQYFSIRTATRTSGTISVTKHFEAWAANGMTSINTGRLTEVSLKVESFGNTAGNAIGTAELTTNILKINGVEIQ